MAKHGPILIIEDDIDDQEFLSNAIATTGLHNEIVTFADAIAAMKYLLEVAAHPFLIFCDINLPKMTGLEFRRQLLTNEKLRDRGTPFVFFSTSERADFIREASALSVQGYFLKSHSFDAIVRDVQLIIDYWSLSKHPFSF